MSPLDFEPAWAYRGNSKGAEWGESEEFKALLERVNPRQRLLVESLGQALGLAIFQAQIEAGT